MSSNMYPAYAAGVVDCTVPPSLARAGGMGEQATRAFAAAGAYVTFGDLNETSGLLLQSELRPNAQFVKCDVTDFESQKRLFKAAKQNSPSKTVDIAIANAGISGTDPILKGEDTGGEPSAPDLTILNVNVVGVAYTCKLARFYFLQHELTSGRDRCLIVLSSAAAYADVPGRLVYMMSKFAVRGAMRALRRGTVHDGIRACALAPWFVETNFVSKEVIQFLHSKGVKFANAKDAADAMLHIASDKSINGRCFAVVNREEAPLGYYDMDLDDFTDGSKAGEQQYQFLTISHAA
ncbi:hypothetical protein ABOM_011461 [Aspergillus bombycis]|uniref:Uncharacterized protein n=1 Tax=Aspergillus bombycis TaxID=109264 RepID=A0A1F7ZJN0_9EURO|nr:hypothetical protein ABOM_011461 [Aspergillus bombycis]OGM39646.1 hypothetical protein ABOM_011461 [Aspergillus bombycis]